MSNNLYNKYRPHNFETIEGQNVIKKILLNCFKEEKFIQTYLFHGPHGTGKTSLARIFAKSINCLDFDGKDICNKCKACELINSQSTLDVIEIDAASNNGVEFMRELVSNVQYLPLNIKTKIYIIDEAHSLSAQSWTSLLKVIEEPPQHIVFIFLTTQIKKILPTIQSRCQKFQFVLLNHQELQTLTKKICSLENRSIDEDILERITTLSGGSARELMTILDQLFLNSQETINLEIFKKTFGLASDNTVLKLLTHILNKDSKSALEVLNELYQSGHHLPNLFDELFSMLIELESYHQTSDVGFLQLTKDSGLEKSDKSFLPHINTITELSKHFHHSNNHKSVAKVLLLNLLAVNAPSEGIAPRKEDSEIKQPKLENTSGFSGFFKKNTGNLSKKPTTNSKEELNIKDTPEPIQIKENSQNTNTMEITTAEFNEIKCFSNQTLFLKPDELLGAVTKKFTGKFECDYKALYCFVKADKSKSEIISQKLVELQGNKSIEKNLDFLYEVDSQFKIIASDVACLIFFKSPLINEKFSEAIKLKETVAALNRLFESDYFWCSITSDLVSKYAAKRKTVNAKIINKEQIFEVDKKDLYLEYSNILNN